MLHETLLLIPTVGFNIFGRKRSFSALKKLKYSIFLNSSDFLLKWERHKESRLLFCPPKSNKQKYKSKTFFARFCFWQTSVQTIRRGGHFRVGMKQRP